MVVNFVVPARMAMLSTDMNIWLRVPSRFIYIVLYINNCSTVIYNCAAVSAAELWDKK